MINMPYSTDELNAIAQKSVNALYGVDQFEIINYYETMRNSSKLDDEKIVYFRFKYKGVTIEDMVKQQVKFVKPPFPVSLFVYGNYYPDDEATSECIKEVIDKHKYKIDTEYGEYKQGA